jgi:hypothetical protein
MLQRQPVASSPGVDMATIAVHSTSCCPCGRHWNDCSFTSVAVLGDTSGSAGRKPRPGLLSWPSVGAPRLDNVQRTVLNNQPRTLKTDGKKRTPASPCVPAVLPQLKPNGANAR